MIPLVPVYLLALLLGPLGAPVVVWSRWLPNLFRMYGRRWSELDLPRPYLPVSGSSWMDRERWVLRDPATWRDLGWLIFQPVIGIVPMLLPMTAFCYAMGGLIGPGLFDPNGSQWVGQLYGSRWLALVGGVLLVVAMLALSPPLVRAHSLWSSLLLRPTAKAMMLVEREELTARVEQLTETRTAATDTQAAEVRRIERDLHDGAQARLVAMGMTLGAIEALIDQDPAAAKALVSKARDSSASALAELRTLVRGIHPPILAERGLADAIRAIALDSPLDVQVKAALDGQLAAPVESAAYFAVAELLTNAARHSGAERVWIDLRHLDSALRISVLDDGTGGADPSRGSGLRGIERRLGTFDGRVTVSSPSGGPTMVTMELPCALSSPKTSTFSATD
ncbi:sensor histidine kinase [Fodinicola feengrottensis]|uniref:sensor histidine kinase n=1 Tax=Fodinicola feengrottensis TaxID=435914 RepID=UPI0024434FFC|nr:sensor histidine kinase [Fodinicola feengrottensis]